MLQVWSARQASLNKKGSRCIYPLHAGKGLNGCLPFAVCGLPFANGCFLLLFATRLCHVQEGTGITKLIPHLSPEGQDLLQKLLMYNPEDRISAKQALRHAFFREIRCKP